MEAKELIARVRDFLNPQNLIILVCVGSFLPYIVSTLIYGLFFLILFITPKFQKGLFNFSGATLIFVFTIYAVAVALLNKNISGLMVAPVFFGMFIIFCFVRQNITRRTFDTCLTMVCFTVFPAFATAVEEVMKAEEKAGFVYRCVSFYGNANWFGSLSAAIVIICAYKIADSNGKAVFYYFVGFFAMANIFLSASLFALIEVVVGIAAYLLLSRHYRLFCVMLTAGSTGIVLLSALPGLIPRLSEVSRTLGYRVRIWGIAIRGISSRPLFGRGFRGYSQIYGLYENGYVTVHGHNIAIDCLLNFGIIGTILLMVLLVFVFRRVFAVYSADKNSVVAILVISIACAVFAHSFTDLTFFWIQTGAFYMVMLGGIGCEERRLNLDKDLLIRGKYRI